MNRPCLYLFADGLSIFVLLQQKGNPDTSEIFRVLVEIHEDGDIFSTTEEMYKYYLAQLISRYRRRHKISCSSKISFRQIVKVDSEFLEAYSIHDTTPYLGEVSVH